MFGLSKDLYLMMSLNLILLLKVGFHEIRRISIVMKDHLPGIITPMFAFLIHLLYVLRIIKARVYK